MSDSTGPSKGHFNPLGPQAGRGRVGPTEGQQQSRGEGCRQVWTPSHISV